MKKIKTNIITIIILGVILLFASCNNNPVLPEQSKQDGIEITGTVSLDSNAFPSQLQNKSSSRAAFFGYSQASIALDETTFSVVAINEFTKYKITGKFLKLDTGYTYKVTLPISGRWEISICGKSQEGDIDVAGHAFISVTQSDTDGSLRLSDYTPGIVLTPLFKEGQKGSINLKVMTLLEQPGATVEDKYTVNWHWNTTPEGFADVSKDMSYAPESFSESFVFSDVPIGAYQVQIEFCDKNNNTLFTTDQWIHVFSGFTTDTWYGYGPQYYEYDSDGDNDPDTLFLALTQEAISYFATSQSTTYSENSVLYKQKTAEEFDIQIITQNNYLSTFEAISLPDVILPDSLNAYGNSLTNTFCYGKNNTIYVAGEVMDDEYYNMYHYLYEIQQNGTGQYYLFEDPDDQSDYKYESTITAINYDESSGHIFIINEGKELLQNNDYCYFQKLFEVELDSDSNTAIIKNIYKIGQKNQQINTFLIEDGLLYLSEYKNKCIFLDVYLIDSDNNILTQLASKKLIDLSESKYNTNAIENHIVLINDMVYVNNSLYILMSDYFTNLYYSYCRGGVVKYDTFTQTCGDIAGFATTDTFGNYATDVKFLCSSDSSTIIQTYTDPQCQVSDEYYLEIQANNYSPSNANSEFYGPKKIISYNDSYLYITDSGIKILLDNEKKTSFENINRIAKFNIADMEIEEIISGVDSEVNFELEKDKVFTSGTEGYSLDTVVYDYNGETLSIGTKVYPYILKHQD